MNKYLAGPYLVAFAAILWAIDAPFRKYLTADLSSTTIVFMEHILIMLIVVAGFWPHLKKVVSLTTKEWWAVVFIGFGGSALATILFTQSFHYLNPSVAILLQKFQPLMAILLAAVVLREKLTKYFWLWALVAIVGAYLVSFPEVYLGGMSFSGGGLGIVLALLAAFFWGGSTVFGRYVLQNVSFQTMTAIRFVSAFLFLFIIELVSGKLPEVAAASFKDWLFVFVTAIVAGFVSLFIYYKGLSTTRASIATLAELAFPFAAVIVNWIFLDATLSPIQLAGGVILIFAITRLSLVNASYSTAA